jgi:ectoine hydroxylase-related dioxygenase (phytanoyl-CoA dioxygenase family)
VNFKPPRHPDHPEYDHKGFLHVDADLTVRPVGNWVQGVLYLTDTAPDQGGFQCVPGRHKFLRAWVENNPPDAELPDLQPEKAIPIPGKAGDFVIWDGLLPHGNGQNLADRPRFAQFISMYPAEYGSEEERQKRIRDWQEREPPGGRVFPGDPRRIEQQFGQTAALTPLGRKLLGIDAWE